MRPNPHARTGNRRFGRSAFSLIEIMAMTGVIFVISAIATVAMVGFKDKSEAAKLRSDVATINSAIKIYLASADVVELLSTSTSVRPVINGVTNGSKFLIYEGATATGKIYGKFIPRY